MNGQGLTWELFADEFTICRFDPAVPLPGWVVNSSWWSVVRSDRELSIVCRSGAVPAQGELAVEREPGWRMLRVAEQLDFSIVGLLADVLQRLAAVSISVFVISSFETDYLLIRKGDLSLAMLTLKSRGDLVKTSSSDDLR